MQATWTLARPARRTFLAGPVAWPLLGAAALLAALLGWAVLSSELRLGQPVALAGPDALEQELAGLPVPGELAPDWSSGLWQAGGTGFHQWTRAQWQGAASPAEIIAALGPALARDGWVMQESTWGAAPLSGIQLATLHRGRTSLRLSVMRPPGVTATRLAALLER